MPGVESISFGISSLQQILDIGHRNACSSNNDAEIFEPVPKCHYFPKNRTFDSVVMISKCRGTCQGSPLGFVKDAKQISIHPREREGYVLYKTRRFLSQVPFFADCNDSSSTLRIPLSHSRIQVGVDGHRPRLGSFQTHQRGGGCCSCCEKESKRVFGPRQPEAPSAGIGPFKFHELT
jgi:hypothetical protein